MKDFENFIKECEGAPRLNQLAGFFSETAGGKGGRPIKMPHVDRRLLPNDSMLHRFIGLHERRQGFFDQHYHSSIPYRLEEEFRMAFTLLRYSLPSLHEVSLYSLGTAEGTMARSLSEFSEGKIQSLSCSPNRENLSCFMAFGEPPHADFFLGPFHRLSKDHIRSDRKLERFVDGFDVILEDTTFQMYSSNRLGQIGFVSQHLRPDGIFLFLEKFRSANEHDYAVRESQKDFGFKSQYFGVEEIERKTKRVLTTMHDCEVTLKDMADAVYTYFKHCVVTWNSGNFYGLAASNSSENLLRYLTSMPEPAIPREYVYDPTPWQELSSWLKRCQSE
ncbi:class I SAM-dependent methyltransferase [Agrobacterium tumefaciens]|uniref:class I SAM-dependent methyltransferase n=1 Tax=Agrobacterium tumefaciens TaxID=358 RepID=UPI000977C99B|nr:hypothetical protein BV900_26720 [Agrobacterium tumefaciens]